MKKGLIILLIILFMGLVAGRVQVETNPKDSNEEISKNDVSPTVTPQISESEQIPNSDPKEGEDSVYPMEITDSDGNIVQFDEEPQRVISLGPNITEIIYAIGKGDKLVGRTAFCDYPKDAENAVIVGDFIEWNLETIVSLEPDVVFASSLNTEENEKKLKDLGIKMVFLTQTESFKSVYESIGMIGKILNAGDNADKIIGEMKQTVFDVQNAVEGKKKPSVYYVVGYGEYGDYTATGETFISSMIEMAGANNIAADETGWVYSLEKLIEKDPDIIICTEDAKQVFQNTNGYKELTAVKEGRIYAVDADLLELQGPRLAEGLHELYKIFHGDSLDTVGNQD